MKSSIKLLMPFYQQYHKLNYSKQNIGYFDFLKYKIFGSSYYWCKHKHTYIGMPKHLFIGKNSLVLREYNFLQASGGIYIGNYVRFATRVSLLSSNHDLYDQNISHNKPIIIGDYSWLGMHSTLLAGVEIGPRTIVANGAVVTKSFPEGMCVLAGVPAKVVKRLDPNLFHPWTFKHEFYGFLPAKDVESDLNGFISKYLDINTFNVKDGRIQIKDELRKTK